MRIEVITPATVSLVTLDEAKAFLRVDHTAEDALITRAVSAATSACERATMRTFRPTTLLAYFDAHMAERLGRPSGIATSLSAALPLVLPRGPVQSVSAVEALAADGTPTEIDVSAYALAGDRLTAIDSAAFPAPARYSDALAVTYTAGLGTVVDVEGSPTLTGVPDDLVQAVLVTLADLYEHRTTAVVGTVAARVPSAATDLLAPFVNYAFG